VHELQLRETDVDAIDEVQDVAREEEREDAPGDSAERPVLARCI
jgi:hypothetical protein